MNDFIIIGAGPVGLYGAYLAGLRGLKGCIIESLPIYGGQLMTLYPEKSIYDLPGFVEIKASTFIQHLYTQYSRFKDSIPIYLSTSVTALDACDDHTYRVSTDEGKTFHTRTVIFTSGIGKMQPKLLEPSFAPHPLIQYGLEAIDTYQHQDIVILGGGNTALDYANLLLPIAKSVTLVHRRQVFKAFEASLHSFQAFGGHVLVPYHLTSYKPLNQGLEVTLKDETDATPITLKADRIIVCFGYSAQLGHAYHPDLIIASKKHGFENNKFIVNAQYLTSLPEVYAAGDAITYEGKASHLAQGFGEVTTIMEIIHHQFYPETKIPHSSFLNLK
jgi:thioredoxin reductase (NADPH)